MPRVAILILDAPRDSWNTAYERGVTYPHIADYGYDYNIVYGSEPLPKPGEVDIIDIQEFCCQWQEEIARNYQVPLISTVEETNLTALSGYLQGNKIDLNFMLDRIKHYISRSAWSRDMLIHGFQISGDHITYIPHGVDLKLFKPTMKEPEDKSFLYVGSLTKNKGTDILLDAYMQIASKTDWGLTIIGGFSNDENIVADIKKCAGDNKKIQFIQSPPPVEELIEYYQNVSVFVHPQSYDYGEPLQFGHPFLWALASGLPAISLDTGIARDYIINGENGFLCQKYKEIPERMLEITQMSWKEMGGASRLIAERNHDPKKIGAKYKEVYDNVTINIRKGG